MPRRDKDSVESELTQHRKAVTIGYPVMPSCMGAGLRMLDSSPVELQILRSMNPARILTLAASFPGFLERQKQH